MRALPLSSAVVALLLSVGCGSAHMTCGSLQNVCGVSISCPSTLADFKQQICAKQSLELESCANGWTAISVTSSGVMVTYYYDAKGQLTAILDSGDNFCYGPASLVAPTCGSPTHC